SAPSECRPDLLLDRLSLRLRMQRPNRCSVRRSISERQLLDLAKQLLDELVADSLVDKNPLHHQARLAAVEETSDAGSAHGCVHVSIVEDDHRIGAAKLKCHAFHPARGELGYVLADGCRASESYLRHLRVSDERLPQYRPLAGNNLK